MLAKFFRRNKITGWRRHLEIRKAEAGNWKFSVRPDFVFLRPKLAVFVDGCFWHGCPKHGTQPKGNAKYWRKKISNNQIRDRTVVRTLRKSGWQVLRIWEHDLRQFHESGLLQKFYRYQLKPRSFELCIKCVRVK